MKLSHLLLILAMAESGCQASHSNSHIKADAIGRRLLGPAIPYNSQNLSPEQKEITKQSIAATRRLAWQVFSQVVERTDVAVAKPDGSTSTVSVPRLFTYYGSDDVQRLMRSNFASTDQAVLKAGTELPEETFQKSQSQLQTELDRLPLPLQKKWQRYITEHPTLSDSDLIGVSGMNRTLYSPDLISAMIRRYAALQDCFPAEKKPLPQNEFIPCWQAPLPASSVMIKTAWMNSRSTFESFTTDADSLQKLFVQADSSWAQHGQAIPTPEGLMRARFNNEEFVLGGLHIVSKDLDDWLWISAFWSPNPDADFGEDRPDFVKNLGPPWNQYKICAVSSYSVNPASIAELEGPFPSLAAAYKVVSEGREGSSWCSNPYIEKGVHNHRGNCIGCHQFAGTDVQQERILADPTQFPLQGSKKQRKDFPTDYIWSASQGSSSWLSLLNNLLYFRQNQQ